MYFDLNVLVPSPALSASGGPAQSKKGKGKQFQAPPTASFTPGQINTIEAKLDLLVHLGYTAVAFNQIAVKRVDPKSHVNILDGLVSRLRSRPGVVYLKRLTIVLDEDSEKGFGLTNSTASLFAPYDLLSLIPTTATTFSLACLTHTQPSNLTTHIISLPLTLPRLPFHLKHTQVRAAIKNGAVFEINYSGALGDASDGVPGAEGGGGAKRNWWAAAREVVRVTKGKGIIVSGGVCEDANLRAPRDVSNLLALLGLSQDVANDASTKMCKSLVLRAQTRKTYRAVLSEPVIVIPSQSSSESTARATTGSSSLPSSLTPQPGPSPQDPSKPQVAQMAASASGGQKRMLEEDATMVVTKEVAGGESAREKVTPHAVGDAGGKKKKRKKNKHPADGA